MAIKQTAKIHPFLHGATRVALRRLEGLQGLRARILDPFKPTPDLPPGHVLLGPARVGISVYRRDGAIEPFQEIDVADVVIEMAPKRIRMVRRALGPLFLFLFALLGWGLAGYFWLAP